MKNWFIAALLLLTSKTWADDFLPYLQSPTEDSIHISWKTTTGTESKVLYGTSEDNLNFQATGSNKLLGAGYRYHTVELNDLIPDTFYFYKVKTGSGTSAIYRFKTQPEKGSNTGHYRFLVVGDHQVRGDNRYKHLVESARAKVEEKYAAPIEEVISLVVNTGDQVDVGTLDHYENLHFKQSAALMSNVPFITAIGNHEYYSDSDLSNYFSHFSYDHLSYKNLLGADGENYYAFQVANIVFVVMNSNVNWQRQWDWLQSVATTSKNDNQVEWLFGIAHHPMYAEQLSGDERAYIRNTAVPNLVNSGKMATFFSGHAHLYARGQMRNDPVYHVINGGASWDQRWGDVPGQEIDYEDVQKTMELHVYQIVDIDLNNREMIVETYSTGNKDMDLPNVLVDTFYLKLDAAGPQTPTITNVPNTLTPPYQFTGSPYLGNEPYNSTEFQITGADGNFESPLKTVKRDFENLYQSTGYPNFTSIDQNANIDIFNFDINSNDVYQGNNFVRVRYRDQSAHWSDWSTPQAFQSIEGLQPLQQTPIGYYSLNTDGYDQSNKAQHGVLNGVGFSNDSLRGDVAEFNNSGLITMNAGDTDMVEKPRRAMTVSTWVYTRNADTWGGFVGLIQDNGSYEKGWLLGSREQRFSFALASKNTGSLTYLTAPDNFSLNQWYHLSATYDGNTSKLYVDGVLVASDNSQSGDIDYPTTGWYQIGAYKDDNEAFSHDGYLDDVMIWERALSTTEITALANSNGSDPVAVPQPITYYPLAANADDSLGQLDGSISAGITFVNDEVRGDVANFNGNGIIDITNGSNPSQNLPTMAMTVMTWVKVDNAFTWGGFFGQVQDNGSYEKGWILGTRGQNFSFALSGENSSGLTYLKDSSSFDLGQWYHLAASYDGNTMHLYVNGELVNSSTDQQGAIDYPPTGWLQIGAYKDDDEDFRHRGRLSDVKLYDRVLNQTQIQALMASD